MDETFTGHLMETTVFMALQTVSELWSARLSFARMRQYPFREVDFVMERDRRRIAVEVKLSNRVSYEDARNAVWLMGLDKQFAAGVVIYTGTEVRLLTDRVVAVPWTML